MAKKIVEKNNASPRDSAVFSDFTDTKKYKDSKRGIVTVIIIVVLIIAFLMIALSLFFSVKRIIIDGVESYDFNTILDASGIEYGDLIVFLSKKNIKTGIITSLPFVRNVKTTIQLPDSVYLEIIEEKPEYYFEIDGEWFLINEELKVLSKFNSEKLLLEKYPDVRLISIPKVKTAVTSKKVIFYDDYSSRHTDEILLLLNDLSYYDKLTVLNLENRFELTFEYEGRIIIKAGNYDELKKKLDTAIEIIGFYSPEETGTIIIDDLSNIIVRMEEK